MDKFNKEPVMREANPFFQSCHEALLCFESDAKVMMVKKLHSKWLEQTLYWDDDYAVDASKVDAGFPKELNLVEPRMLKRRRLHSTKGKAVMLHAIAHIEFNAINLALDACYRFRGMPTEFYLDWLTIACEEAYHFTLLEQHLNSLGYCYGDFPAHNGLWEMARTTAYDVLVRMALVPRILEARGLDVAPQIIKRLIEAKEFIAAEILAVIFNDEITHVKIGNKWYHHLCSQRKVNPVLHFIDLVRTHAPDTLRGPIDRDARLAAGFSQKELELINKIVRDGVEQVAFCSYSEIGDCQ